MTVGGLLTLASTALAAPAVDGMHVVDPMVGAWGCYEVTKAGDLVLYPYPQRAAWTSSADPAQADDHTILGWRGFYEVKPGGSVALEPFSDPSTATMHEEACVNATIH
jgi:hypothetical protein